MFLDDVGRRTRIAKGRKQESVSLGTTNGMHVNQIIEDCEVG
jgi:hypothetical protein